MPYFDAHNHLQNEWLEAHLDRIGQDIARAGIGGMVVNGTCEADWPAVASLAARFVWVRPSFGLHPWDVGNATSEWRTALLRRLEATPQGAIGEVGLDRWILERARPDDSRLAGLRRAPLAEQLEAFRWQLALAAERDLPLSIHCLDAWGPLAAALRDGPRPRRGFLLHAYGGSAEMAQEFAALGAHFSFNGAFLGDPAQHEAGDKSSGGATARSHARERDRVRAKRYAEVFAGLPRDRLLVETDAPAMPLPPARESFALPPLADGTRINHPANLISVYAGLAEIVALPLAVLTTQVEENFRRLFG